MGTPIVPAVLACQRKVQRWAGVPGVLLLSLLLLLLLPLTPRCCAPEILRAEASMPKASPVLAAPFQPCTNERGQTNTTMYDPEYFPTPTHVIQQMLAPYRRKTDVGRHDDSKLEGLTILDPSAGSGNLLAFVKELFHPTDCPKLHAIEVNPTMQPLLREKFTLVHDDFLTFQTDVRYDLILMNPPFSNGDAHLEKAWNILQHGDIVCLLNAETIRNPHSARRKWLVQLIADHGSVEYIGKAFKHSSRTTAVEVAMVRVTKHDEGDRFTFWEEDTFQPEDRDFTFHEEGMADLPAVNDKIAAMVHQYQLSQSAFVQYMKAYRKLLHHADPLIEDDGVKLLDMLTSSLKHETGKGCFNAFVTDLQTQAWESIFSRTQLYDLMSTSVRADFQKMRKQQGGMPFTEANIRGLLELLFTNRDTILQKCVEEAFEIMTSYSDDNRTHWEGWKTNSAYKVNRKVIIPGWAVSYDKEYGTWRTNYNRYEKWTDIDRACAMLEGKRLSSPTAMQHMDKDDRPYHSGQVNVVTIRDAIERRFFELRERKTYTHYVDNVCESEYFHIKFWKKGTVHLVFKDEHLWQRFNQQAALGKKWLPNDPNHVPTPKADPADNRYAARLLADNLENRKLMITA